MAQRIEARDDADAVQQAQDLKRGALMCEVWQNMRLVEGLHAQQLRA